ncbi:MAG: cadmium-translocating P-type ATPase [Saprospiraceae bacterium]|jgi:Cu+-exporting ATPase|nr:cadmium-translocating P-type ATPase [Saprospiraceae bacterium]
MANPIIEWKVEGMDCNNCATSISRFLERKGLQDVFVNFQTGEVRFRRDDVKLSLDDARAGIHKLGYVVATGETERRAWTLERKLWVSAIFTAPLLLNHLLMAVGVHVAFMHNPWVQLVICLPVMVIGVWHFGVSAFKSLRGGVPNMDVLIFLGSSAAFIYSLIGAILGEANYIFFETAATIITLVLVGNWLEKRAVEQTTTAIGELTKLQVEKARKVMPSGTIVTLNREEIQIGDILQVNEGDKIPTDGIIASGLVTIDESMLTGESTPVDKQAGDSVIGASVLLSGNMQMRVTATGRDTVLNQMIELVKTAQRDKPDIQRLADRISAIFVPAVVSISLLTLVLGHIVFDLSFKQALMNAIAVLVISCPCAMGLATPTAVMVGVGRLARNGILIKGGQTVELFANLKHIVFDKTGTLTTGRFQVSHINYRTEDHKFVHALLYALEKHSSHPIAQSLVEVMEPRLNGTQLNLVAAQEQRGLGVVAEDADGNIYKVGSRHILSAGNGHAMELNEDEHLYLTQNDRLLATVSIIDDIRPEARRAISDLKDAGLHPVILSGDHQLKTSEVAFKLGVNTFHAEQLPAQKLEIIEQLAQKGLTAMVGDGINDAPALARAHIGISMGNASQAAIESAQVILLNPQLNNLPIALHICRLTVKTIRQNLFWAFAYNIVAIPIAAVGLLNPMWGALFMAFSDVVVIGNSIRLKYKS